MHLPCPTASMRRFGAFSKGYGLTHPNPPSGDERVVPSIDYQLARARAGSGETTTRTRPIAIAHVWPSVSTGEPARPRSSRPCAPAMRTGQSTRGAGGQATLPQQSVAKVLACGQAPRRNLVPIASAGNPSPRICRDRSATPTAHPLCNSAFPIPSSKNGLLIAIGLRFAAPRRCHRCESP